MISDNNVNDDNPDIVMILINKNIDDYNVD